MDSTLTLSLGNPIEHERNRYTQLTLREPTVGEVLDANKRPQTEMMVHLIAAVAGVHPHVVQKLPFSKFSEAVRFIERFLAPEGGQPTG